MKLAPTAFFKHVHDRTGTVCPGQRKRGDLNDAEMSETDHPLDVKSPKALDSTFQLESSDENESQNKEYSHGSLLSSPGGSNKPFDILLFTTNSSDSEDSTVSSLDEEVWDGIESDDDKTAKGTSSTVSSIVSGITFFLVFFSPCISLVRMCSKHLIRFHSCSNAFLSVVCCYKVCLHCTLEPVSSISGTGSARPH